MIKKLAAVIVLVMTALIFVAGCTTQTTSPTAAPTPTPSPIPTSAKSAAVQNYDIVITEFLPGVTLNSNITVKQGASVTWSNFDVKSHRITSITGLFDSGNLATGDQFTYQFNEKGTFPYLYDGVGTETAVAGTRVVTFNAPQINVQ